MVAACAASPDWCLWSDSLEVHSCVAEEGDAESVADVVGRLHFYFEYSGVQVVMRQQGGAEAEACVGAC